MIKANYEIIKKNVEDACNTCGRNPKDVLILAVTKNHTAQEINMAIDLGITDIGENRVQELLQKYDDVKKGVRWHIIGHLQTNKVKYIADKVCMIHSVDSVKLALEIDRQCKKLNKVMDILIEINSGEVNKNGIEAFKAFEVIEEISKLSNVRIKGLMTMAPLEADNDKLKNVFSSLYKLAVDIRDKKYDNVFMEGHLEKRISKSIR